MMATRDYVFGVTDHWKKDLRHLGQRTNSGSKVYVQGAELGMELAWQAAVSLLPECVLQWGAEDVRPSGSVGVGCGGPEA